MIYNFSSAISDGRCLLHYSNKRLYYNKRKRLMYNNALDAGAWNILDNGVRFLNELFFDFSIG